MRTSNKKLYLVACLFAPLWACGSDTTGGTQVKLPDNCTSGQVLTTDANGQLVCTALPIGSQKLKDCVPLVEALTSDDGATFKCTNRNNENPGGAEAVTAVNTITTTLNTIETTVNNLLGSRQTFGEFKGVTTATTAGNITSGAMRGVPAASAICAAQFGAGAYMCSVYDMYMNVARGKVAQNDSIAKSWVYMQSWKEPAAGSSSAGNGVSDNCGSYTTAAATGYWGTAVEWTSISNGSKGLKFSSGNTAPNSALCSAALPIACCL